MATTYASLSTKKKKLVAQLEQFTGTAGREACIEVLLATSWDVQAAADLFFSGAWQSAAGGAGAGGDDDAVEEVMDPAKLAASFATYAEPDDPTTIQVDGLVRLCADLGVSPEDVVLVVLSKHFGAANMFTYTQEEFNKGMQSLGADSVEALKGKVPEMRESLALPAVFREVYAFTFGWACADGQKSMEVATAVALWRLLLPGRFALLDEWCDFVEKTRKHAISHDTWMLLVEFAKVVDKDLNGYDENSAFPVLIDEFVDHVEAAKKTAAAK